jgi:hypothetical protein
MKLDSHVVMGDAGLAPNPFHGWLTTALCTPSHMNRRLEVSNWLIGHSSARANDPHCLVYAMNVCEVLTMDKYFDFSSTPIVWI